MFRRTKIQHIPVLTQADMQVKSDSSMQQIVEALSRQMRATNVRENHEALIQKYTGHAADVVASAELLFKSLDEAMNTIESFASFNSAQQEIRCWQKNNYFYHFMQEAADLFLLIHARDLKDNSSDVGRVAHDMYLLAVANQLVLNSVYDTVKRKDYEESFELLLVKVEKRYRILEKKYDSSAIDSNRVNILFGTMMGGLFLFGLMMIPLFTFIVLHHEAAIIPCLVVALSACCLSSSVGLLIASHLKRKATNLDREANNDKMFNIHKISFFAAKNAALVARFIGHDRVAHSIQCTRYNQ